MPPPVARKLGKKASAALVSVASRPLTYDFQRQGRGTRMRLGDQLTQSSTAIDGNISWLLLLLLPIIPQYEVLDTETRFSIGMSRRGGGHLKKNER